ncbi:DNA cytosine methyltransferase [Paenibacillus sp. Leaf72]|uniref:DNA cytosine methyltransferase n=1 Tax=Paenibacillus sp. Leaf72 TaxID=1736234 RepID=UPI0006F6AB26|nr:DNA cytosine methyltransferase [Paenibacillus sp. Leaf72]KQN96830.1 hypothetical protein ASF12_22420 [Paenibacillus sp. Leaf72]
MLLALKKVYTVTKKQERPRIWLYELICEAAGFKPGDELFIASDQSNQQITIKNVPIGSADDKVHVSSRKNETSGKLRPIVDTAKESYRSIIDIKQKIEISVYRDGAESMVVVQPLKFQMFEKEIMVRPNDERITTFTICSGAGYVSAAFQDTGYFSSVGAVELEEDSAAVYNFNFPSTFLFNGNLLDCSTVAKADVAIVTLPCNEFSSLGNAEGGVFNNLSLAATDLIRATQCRTIFFENVPSFYKTDAYLSMKELLKNDFLYWQEENIEALDFGSIARRNRTYAVAFRHREDFLNFQFPKPPKNIRRKKLREYLDGKNVQHAWKPLEKWMKSFSEKVEKGNSWKDRSLTKTFVDRDATEIQCIPKRYTGQSASSTYLLSEDKQSFRFFSIDEIRRILSVPDWFEYPDYIGKIRQYEMIGQSVDCRIIKSIANTLATMWYKVKCIGGGDDCSIQVRNEIHDTAITLEKSGQFGFIF